VRIVGGTLGGREIARSVPRGVRPTTDRVREAIFSSLETRGAIRGARVLDLFGGTGAMGFEALSRGAARVDYVERNAKVAEAAKREATRLGLSTQFVPWVESVEQVLQRNRIGEVDVVFADPPYEYLAFGVLGDAMPTARWVVIESDRDVDLGERWEPIRVHRYGRTVVALYQPCGQEELSR